MRILNRLIILIKILAKRLLKNRFSKVYLSGNGFAHLCDLRINSMEEIAYDEVRVARSIFVKSDLLIEFLLKYDSEIKGKIILSGNGDTNFNEEILQMHTPSKLYIQNMGFKPSSETINILPIGLENFEHMRSGFGFMHKPTQQKKEARVLIPPMSATNPIRSKVISQLGSVDSQIFQVEKNYTRISKYLKITKKYSFILACEGNGYDTHRLWEIFYQESFPVLLNSQFSRNIANLGLPVLLVDSITDITKDMLKEHLTRFSHYNREHYKILWLNYWRKEIQDHEWKLTD